MQSETIYYKSNVRNFAERLEMHNFFAKEFLNNQKIHFLEFGVYRGQTFEIWAESNKNAESIFWGFDTFTGLPEDWGNWRKGSFSTNGRLPQLSDGRCNFFVGLIQDKLPQCIHEIDVNTKKVIHIDVDIYSATLFTLLELRPVLRNGDIIIFDDFFTIVVADHEFKAFKDFMAMYEFSYKPLAKSRRGHYIIEVCN